MSNRKSDSDNSPTNPKDDNFISASSKPSTTNHQGEIIQNVINYAWADYEEQQKFRTYHCSLSTLKQRSLTTVIIPPPFVGRLLNHSRPVTSNFPPQFQRRINQESRELFSFFRTTPTKQQSTINVTNHKLQQSNDEMNLKKRAATNPYVGAVKNPYLKPSKSKLVSPPTSTNKNTPPTSEYDREPPMKKQARSVHFDEDLDKIFNTAQEIRDDAEKMISTATQNDGDVEENANSSTSSSSVSSTKLPFTVDLTGAAVTTNGGELEIAETIVPAAAFGTASVPRKNSSESIVESIIAEGMSSTALAKPPSNVEWMAALQDQEVKSGSNVREKWPLLWKVVCKYYRYFLEMDYETAKNSSNQTDFKKTVLQNILENRVRVDTHVMPLAEDNQLPSDKKKSSFIYYYRQTTFEEYASKTYKTDERKKLNPTVNDTLRLFGIAALGKHRDALARIAMAKDGTRLESDWPEDTITRIFRAFAVDFNNLDLDLPEPKRAVYLGSYRSMDPNDMMRIIIERDWPFLKNLYFRTLKKYSKALNNFQKNTGGGPGDPENLLDWKERDDEQFASYGGKDGDMLAWIFMIDKQIGFFFNAINNSAPSETVMEDANTKNGNNIGKARATKSKFTNNVSNMIQMQQNVMERFGDCMDQGYKMIEDFTRSAQAWNEDKKDEIEKMHITVVVIEKLDRKIELLKMEINRKDCTDPMKRKLLVSKLNALEKCLSKAYMKLDNEQA